MIWYLIAIGALVIGAAIGWFAKRRPTMKKTDEPGELFHWTDRILNALLLDDDLDKSLDTLFLESALQISNADLAMILESSGRSEMGINLSGDLIARTSITIALRKQEGSIQNLSDWNQAILEWEWSETNDDKASDHQVHSTWISEFRAVAAHGDILDLSAWSALVLIPISSESSANRWLALGSIESHLDSREPVEQLAQDYLRIDSDFRKKACMINIGDQAFENSVIAKVLVADDRMVRLNNAFKILADDSEDHFLGKHFDKIFMPEDIPEVREHLIEILQGHSHQEILEVRMLKRDGSHIPILVYPTAVRYHNKNAFIIGIKDVSSQVNLEQSLLGKIAQQELVIEELVETKSYLQIQSDDLQERLQDLITAADLTENIVHGIPHWIRVIDPNFNVTFINQSMRQSMGDLIGKKCYQTMGYGEKCPDCPINQSSEDDKPHPSEITMGPYTYSVICSPVVGPDGSLNGAVELIQDISELKTLQDTMRENSDLLEAVNESVNSLNHSLEKATGELEEKNVELHRLNKELKTLDELKDNFVSTVSHELKAPLTSIKGSVSLILGGMVGEVDPKIEQFLTVCQRNVDRLILLINDLLDLSRIESGRIEIRPDKHKLKTIAEEAIEDLSNYAQNDKVDIRVDVPKGLIAWVDHDRFIQVLQNLLSNALKFTESGSVVIHAERMDSGVRVQIEDTGIGIPTDQLDKIFGKFNQVDGTLTRKIGGTGLGLAICKAIVQEHGGNISVSSKIGKGSCFTIDLPDSNKYRHESESMEKEESAADLLLDEKQ